MELEDLIKRLCFFLSWENPIVVRCVVDNGKHIMVPFAIDYRYIFVSSRSMTAQRICRGTLAIAAERRPQDSCDFDSPMAPRRPTIGGGALIPWLVPFSPCVPVGTAIYTVPDGLGFNRMENFTQLGPYMAKKVKNFEPLITLQPGASFAKGVIHTRESTTPRAQAKQSETPWFWDKRSCSSQSWFMRS